MQHAGEYRKSWSTKRIWHYAPPISQRAFYRSGILNSEDEMEKIGEKHKYNGF